eukprot:202648_1
MLADDDTEPFFSSQDDQAICKATTQIDNEPYQPIKTNEGSKSITSSFNLPFIYFIVASIISIAISVLYIMDPDMGFMLSGVIGIAICLYAFKHFRTVIDLSVSIDEFYALNCEFKTEHKRLQTLVDRISSAHETIKDTHNRLVISNAKNRENLTRFRGIQDTMETCNTTSLEDLQNVLNRSQNVEAQWHLELYQHERDLLQTIFDRFCSNQDHIGMNRDEFEAFSAQLPGEYKERFRRMGTFDVLSGNKNIILFEDFEKTLDIFAEMQANDCDIEFHIKPTQSKRKVDPKESLKNRKMEFMSVQRLVSIAEDSMEDSDIDFDVDADDDRAYDDELITFHRQVVITRRTAPGVRLDGSVNEMVEQFRLTGSMSPQVSSLSVASSSSADKRGLR